MSVTNPDDLELEQLMAETAELKQRYRASSRDEPSAAIDNAIRATARRAVRARPRLAGSPFSGSWRIPLSIAAVVVVSATVTLLIAQRDAHLPVAEKESVPTAIPAQQTPASLAPLAQSERVPAPPRLKARSDAEVPDAAAQARLGAQENSASADAATGVNLQKGAISAAREAKAPEPKIAEPKIQEGAMPGRTVPTAKIPEPNTSAPLAASEYRQQPFPTQTKPAPTAPSNAATQFAPAAPTGVTALPRDVAARPASVESPASSSLSQQSAARNAGHERDSARESPREGVAAKDDASVPAAPAAAAGPMHQMPAKRSAGMTADSGPVAEENTRARGSAREQAARAELSSEAPAALWEQDPKAWLKHIEELRTAGLFEDAKASFKTFRSRYPDFPLPAGFVVPAPDPAD